MSKALSLKLKDEVFKETEKILHKNRQPRNAYINEAIHFYNKMWERKLLKEALRLESARVAADSMEVLEAFEQLEDDLRE